MMLVGWLAGCLAAWMPKDGKGRAVAPIESFTRFQLAAIIDFHRFSTIFMIFMDFGAWVPKNGKRRAVAFIESFTRFQLAAIIDFH